MERTELAWTYEPADFFEAPYAPASPDCSFHIDGGKAIATLRPPQSPVDPTLEDRIARYLRGVFLVRQLQMHRKYHLAERAIVHQFNASGGKGAEIRVVCGDTLRIGMRAEFVLRHADGTVIHDSRAERIASHTLILDMVAPKAAQSPTLYKMLESYKRSVSDSDNELVHLYEIRDALRTHFGSEARAKIALGITREEWGRIGTLANHEPLLQGRHWGTHPTTRPATASELEEARALVHGWIIDFARRL